mgnify:CR=1 FL=1
MVKSCERQERDGQEGTERREYYFCSVTTGTDSLARDEDSAGRGQSVITVAISLGRDEGSAERGQSSQ